MSTSPHRAAPPADIVAEVPGPGEEMAQANGGFDPLRWQEASSEREFAGAGGRTVLATGLIVLAALWIGYCAWAAGRALAGQPLTSPALAQWVALAAGPLAMLGLVWMLFGRTRRRETERFTRSVVAMRAEARSLEALLAVLSQRIGESQHELGRMAQQLMQLGDEAAQRLGSVTRDLDGSTEQLARHGQSLDRAAENARNDIAVLLQDLPRAEAEVRTLSEQLRSAGSNASAQAATFEEQSARIAELTRTAEEQVAAAAGRLVTHLTHIEGAGAAAAARIGEAEGELTGSVELLLNRTSEVLDQIRGGIDTQSLAVAALVDQASNSLDLAGGQAAERLRDGVSGANDALDALATRLAEQEQASRRITAETAGALGELGQRFDALALQGDERAGAIVAAIARARAEVEALDGAAASQGEMLAAVSQQTDNLRAALLQLGAELRGEVVQAVNDTEQSTERLLQAAARSRPEIEWMRDAAREASERLAAGTAGIAEQQDRFAALLASIDEGFGGTETRLAQLAATMAEAGGEAERLGRETGPALVQAMLQVKEAAAHAAERAREAIAAVVPESAERLSTAAREALERTFRDEIEARLREIEGAAAGAVETARAATARLTQQMLSLGQSAAALEQHMERSTAEQRERDTEAFARRVSLLIDSMHSAAIDVGKILSDEVDDKAWDAYLKGNRGVFARRAVRLLDGSEGRAIRAHYDADGEFQQSVNRYVHDFEAMLRRVMAERDGGPIAIALMSSDVGKLYAALADALERRR
jgi:hypothetical protein